MTKSKHKQTELSTRIRALLKEGRRPEEIMAITGAQRHIVGLVKYHMERQENVRISPKTGKPVRKYTKRKVKAEVRAKPKQGQALIVVPKPKFMQLQQEIETLTARVGTVVEENAALRREVQTLPKVIEVKVPQPFSHYTFLQRLRILFFGGAA